MLQMMFSPSTSTEVITGGEHGELRVHDLRQVDAAVRHVKAHDDHVTTLHWSPIDNDEFVSAGKDRQLMVWDRNALESGVRRLQAPAPVHKVRYAVSVSQ